MYSKKLCHDHNMYYYCKNTFSINKYKRMTSITQIKNIIIDNIWYECSFFCKYNIKNFIFDYFDNIFFIFSFISFII